MDSFSSMVLSTNEVFVKVAVPINATFDTLEVIYVQLTFKRFILSI